MSDQHDKPEPKSISAAERWADKILKWLTPLILAYIATLATRNHERGAEIEKKVETVQLGQQQAVDVAAETRKVGETVQRGINARADDEAKATAINLYGTWKYLDEQAVTPADKIKATEAKATYDDYVKKHQLKK